MPLTEINGPRYHYTLSGDGPPLVLLHGFTGSVENWDTHITAFAERFRVLAVDLPGHGQTDSPADVTRYHMQHTARDLIALFEQVGAAPAHLLGYSMGGRLALYLALTYPAHVQSLILESASPGLATLSERDARIRQDELLAARIEREGIEAFVSFWESIPLFGSQQALPEEVRQRLRDQRLKNNAQGLANSLRGMGTGAQPALWDRLAELKMPALLLAGALDTKFVHIAQQMHAQLPDARLAIIPDAGHTLHLEAPDVFRAQVLGFLSESR